MDYCSKIVAPEPLTAALFASNSGLLENVERSCGASLALSKPTDQHGCFMSVLTARADTEQALGNVVRCVVETLQDIAKSAPSESFCYGATLKLSILVPRGSVGALIGIGGKVVRQMMEESGARLVINDPMRGMGPDCSQSVAIRGEAETLQRAIDMVNAVVQKHSGEPWFRAWVAFPDLPPFVKLQGRPAALPENGAALPQNGRLRGERSGSFRPARAGLAAPSSEAAPRRLAIKLLAAPTLEDLEVHAMGRSCKAGGQKQDQTLDRQVKPARVYLRRIQAIICCFGWP